MMITSFFDVANENKHKVLFWGIIGALVLRAIFIFSGAFLIELTYLNFLNYLKFEKNRNMVFSAFFYSYIMYFSVVDLVNYSFFA